MLRTRNFKVSGLKEKTRVAPDTDFAGYPAE